MLQIQKQLPKSHLNAAGAGSSDWPDFRPRWLVPCRRLRCWPYILYHNALFAKWWATRPPGDTIQRAVNARRVMSNDLSWVTASTPYKLLPGNT